MDKKKNWQNILIIGLIAIFVFIFLRVLEQKRQLKILTSGLENAFIPRITEIEKAIEGAEFDDLLRSAAQYRQTRQFLDTLLKSKIFVAEIKRRKNERAFFKSFYTLLYGWRIPWKQEFSANGRVRYEWGFIFRMEGSNNRIPTCLIYHYNGKENEVVSLEYLGNAHGLPTVEEAKSAIVRAIKKDKKD